MRQDEQGWQSIGTKFVCARCFEDYAVKRFVEDHANERVCSYCSRHAKKPIAAAMDEVLEYIAEGLNTEYEDPVHNVGWESAEGGYLLPTTDSSKGSNYSFDRRLSKGSNYSFDRRGQGRRAGAGRHGGDSEGLGGQLDPYGDFLGGDAGGGVVNGAVNQGRDGGKDTRGLLVLHEPFDDLGVVGLALGRGFEHRPGGLDALDQGGVDFPVPELLVAVVRAPQDQGQEAADARQHQVEQRTGGLNRGINLGLGGQVGGQELDHVGDVNCKR